ncbi:vesicle transport protein SFT2C [Terrapene carolina triunguis]|uniref:Vesicle transport protein n=1 Tax=Terrapene triunguis TaxID=2587831 RepID=A0A674IU89_9SAUR|nr:vesicle transport protein SFT2C [Terrapene carolina triunguis]
MAELNRQLQEYLAQSKNGSGPGPAAPSSSRPTPDAADAGGRTWLGRLSPFSGRSSSSSSPAAGSWPWAAEPDPWLPGLSRWQRLVGSALCLLLAALCFGLAALYAPLLLLRARKFALLWSLGSAFALGAAGFLRGPSRLLWEPSRGTVLYLGALAGTLYAALGLRSTLLTALGAAAQLAAIAGCLLALLPGGPAGLRYLGGLLGGFVRRRVSKTLPV